jgi:hypothetical protein
MENINDYTKDVDVLNLLALRTDLSAFDGDIRALRDKQRFLLNTNSRILQFSSILSPE